MIIVANIVLKICAGISCIGLAMTYVAKTIKDLRKPSDSIKKKIDEHENFLINDKARLDNLECMMVDMRECMMLLLESEVATLEHLEDGNHTHMLSEKKEKINTYIYGHVGGAI